MEETIFSKIISREIPADIIYEDADVIAILDINPVNPGDTLVIPKKWSKDIHGIKEDDWQKVSHVVRKLAPAIEKSLGADGVAIIMNNGFNQLVKHSHIHIIPRYKGDGVHDWEGSPYPEGESQEVAEKLRNAIDV